MKTTADWVLHQVRWETANRYYVARAYEDLLGDWIVEKAWGGLTNNLGNGQQEIVTTMAAAEKALARIHNERKARHYRVMGEAYAT